MVSDEWWVVRWQMASGRAFALCALRFAVRSPGDAIDPDISIVRYGAKTNGQRRLSRSKAERLALVDPVLPSKPHQGVAGVP